MIIHSISVSNWRGVEHIELADMHERLNIVCGPNESGKSTVFEALRFAFFETSSGGSAHKRAVKCWDGVESPKVVVTFSVNATRYTITKQFVKKDFTTLEGGGQVLEGRPADKKLSELIGADCTSRQAKSQDMGLWPMLWLEQGDAGRRPDESFNADSRDLLQRTLESEIGQVTAGPLGQRILDAVEAEYKRYRTTGQSASAVHARRPAATDRQSQHPCAAHPDG
jgi:hypothetical protein